MIESKGKTAFDRFVDVFVLRYMPEFSYLGLSDEETFCVVREKMLPEEQMLRLFVEFKSSGKTPDEWFEEQEMC